MSKVLIIGGMHRSGTSLVANWMQECGLSLGDELIPADWTNPKGHFEDREISHFQRKILEASNVSHYCVEGQSIRIEERFLEEARELIRAREGPQPWGFKDPRTTLLLDFWNSLMPDAKYLLVFRHYTLVVDSLLRRERSLRWNVAKAAFYLRVWKRYNQDLISFVDRHVDRCLVFDILDLLEDSTRVVEYMNAAWGFSFDVVDIRSVTDDSLLTRRKMPLFDVACHLLAPGVQEMYERLNSRSANVVRLVTGRTRVDG